MSLLNFIVLYFGVLTVVSGLSEVHNNMTSSILSIRSIRSSDVQGPCNVVPMINWAGVPTARKQVLRNPVGLVIIQHTALAEYNSDIECEQEINRIRKMHMENPEFQFDDIGENFLICGNGKVYEGAGWDLVGAHTKCYNDKSLGIAFVGEFSTHLPNENALVAARELLDCGVANKHIADDYQLVGHRQLRPFISPGDALQKEIIGWPHWTEYVE